MRNRTAQAVAAFFAFGATFLLGIFYGSTAWMHVHQIPRLKGNGMPRTYSHSQVGAVPQLDRAARYNIANFQLCPSALGQSQQPSGRTYQHKFRKAEPLQIVKVPSNIPYFMANTSTAAQFPGSSTMPGTDTMYMLANTCNGLTGQHFSLALMISYAKSIQQELGLQVRVVLPPFHLRMEYGSWAGVYHSMDMTSHFSIVYDEDQFIADMAQEPFGVEIVSKLPADVQSIALLPLFEGFSFDSTDAHGNTQTNLDGGVDYTEYTKTWASVYKAYDAVKFSGCLWQHMDVPSDFEVLRTKMIAKLQPAPRIKATVTNFWNAHPGYIAVHARTEGDWKDFCKIREENTCFLSSYTIARLLVAHLPAKSTVYLLSGSVVSLTRLTQHLESNGFTVYTKSNLPGGILSGSYGVLTEYAAVLDQHLALRASTFYSSSSSSFSQSITNHRSKLQAGPSIPLGSFVGDDYSAYDVKTRKYIPQGPGDDGQ